MSSLMLLLMCSLPSFARTYDNIFPSSDTGLTGGAFIVGKNGSTRVVVVLPKSFQKDTFTFDSEGRVYNNTNSTVTGKIYINHNVYTFRWQAFSLSQIYYPSGSYYQYQDYYISNIEDTNIEFDTSVREWANDSIYLDKKDIVFISLLSCIAFFVFLGWFLWHKS